MSTRKKVLIGVGVLLVGAAVVYANFRFRRDTGKACGMGKRDPFLVDTSIYCKQIDLNAVVYPDHCEEVFLPLGNLTRRRGEWVPKDDSWKGPYVGTTRTN